MRFLLPVFASGLLFASCSGKVLPAPGQIILAFQTDMKVPEDIDKVRLTVKVAGQVKFDNDYEVGDGRLTLPSTLALVGDPNKVVPASVRLVAFRKGVPKVLRDVITTVPTDRAALLRMPFQWLCWGDASVNPQSTLDIIDSACAKIDETCIAGTCKPATVDVATLPAYTNEAVFGGASQERGTCFDVSRCFGVGISVPTDGGCTIPKPDGDLSKISVGIRLPPGNRGVCDTEQCVIPLDQDAESGYRITGDRITLPQAVCNPRNGEPRGDVVVTTACEAKTESIPTCGPWSSVNANVAAPAADASAPIFRDGSVLPPLDAMSDVAADGRPFDANLPPPDGPPPPDASFPLDGGGPVFLDVADPTRRLEGIAAGGGNIYWLETILGTTPSWELYRCPATGCVGSPEFVGAGQTVATGFRYIDWFWSSVFLKMPNSAGTTLMVHQCAVGTGCTNIDALAGPGALGASINAVGWVSGATITGCTDAACTVSAAVTALTDPTQEISAVAPHSNAGAVWSVLGTAVGTGKIKRCQAVPCVAASATDVATGQDFPTDVRVVAQGGPAHMLWMTRAPGGASKLRECPIDTCAGQGDNSTNVATGTEGVDEIVAYAIDPGPPAGAFTFYYLRRAGTNNVTLIRRVGQGVEEPLFTAFNVDVPTARITLDPVSTYVGARAIGGLGSFRILRLPR